MADMRVISSLDKQPLKDAAWDAFVTSSPNGHLFQTSRWGTLKARFGWKVERFALSTGDTIVAGAQVLYRSLPLGFTLAYIPKGPLLDWNDEDQARTLLIVLRRAVHRHRAFCLKLEPELLNEPAMATTFVRHGLQPSHQTVQPRSTILIDLDGDEEELLGRMKSRSRYNIRLAARKGIVVRDGTVSDLSVFKSLLEETAQRQDFATHSAEFYREAYDQFVHSGQAHLLLAIYENIVLAGLMVFAVGQKAWDMFAASSNTHRNLKPNHLLKWEAIRWARSKGCKIYDLFGIPDEVGQYPERYNGTQPRHYDGMWGVYYFKQGFGGRIIRYMGAYDDVYSRPRYWLYNQSETLLRRIWGDSWHRHIRSG
jgi:peptidoglycan pentaglycine glycine transferase (the first glycine)